MNTTLTRTGKGRVNVSVLTRMRESLRAQEQHLREMQAQIDKLLTGLSGSDAALASAATEAPARPRPFDRETGVAAATADLRESNGNLSAVRVAKLYGVSLSQLAGWLGRSKQAVSKTPDADSLQEALGYFERVARMRIITRGDGEFRKWLRMPHPDVVGKNPLELMAKGGCPAMADFVESILTGTPG